MNSRILSHHGSFRSTTSSSNLSSVMSSTSFWKLSIQKNENIPLGLFQEKKTEKNLWKPAPDNCSIFGDWTLQLFFIKIGDWPSSLVWKPLCHYDVYFVSSIKKLLQQIHMRGLYAIWKPACPQARIKHYLWLANILYFEIHSTMQYVIKVIHIINILSVYFSFPEKHMIQ